MRIAQDDSFVSNYCKACSSRLDEKCERERPAVCFNSRPALSRKEDGEQRTPPSPGPELYTTTHGNAADVDESGRGHREQCTVMFPF